MVNGFLFIPKLYACNPLLKGFFQTFIFNKPFTFIFRKMLRTGLLSLIFIPIARKLIFLFSGDLIRIATCCFFCRSYIFATIFPGSPVAALKPDVTPSFFTTVSDGAFWLFFLSDMTFLLG